MDLRRIEKIRNELQKSVDQMELNQEDMDYCSWGYEVGVLISGNDAKSIIDLIESTIMNHIS